MPMQHRTALFSLIAVLVLAAAGIGTAVSAADDSAATTTYSLFYQPNNGTWADGTIKGITTVESYAVGDVVTPASPQGLTNTGYTFGGWVLLHDANGDGALSSSDVLLCRKNTQLPTESFTVTGPLNADGTSTIALYARWIPSDTAITITFDANGGSGSMSPLVWPASTDCTLPACTYTYGTHAFLHWLQTADNADAYITVVNSATNVTVYAGWQDPVYTITFDANGGTGSTAAVSGTAGTVVTLPASGFTRTGYTFLGWYNTASGTADNTMLTTWTMSATDVTLYATWTTQLCAVTFAAEGGVWDSTIAGVSGDTMTQTYQYGTVFTAAGGSGPAFFPVFNSALTRAGYGLTGWATASGSTTALTTYTVTGDVTLYPIWFVQPTHTVTYDANGGTGTISPVTVAETAYVPLPTTGVTREGYALAGWNGSADATTAVTSWRMGITDITLYAVWSTQVCTVTFNANGGTGSIAEQQVTLGSAAALPTTGVTRDGYILMGWAKTAESSTVLGTFYPTADTTLYAIWSTSVGYTKYVYDANGGTGSIDSEIVAVGSHPTLPTVGLSKDGFTLKGWGLTADATEALTSVTAGVSGTVTLYAVWGDNDPTPSPSDVQTAVCIAGILLLIAFAAVELHKGGRF